MKILICLNFRYPYIIKVISKSLIIQFSIWIILTLCYRDYNCRPIFTFYFKIKRKIYFYFFYSFSFIIPCTIFTLCTFTLFSTFKPSLKTFTIFFLTTWLFTITSFCMGLTLYFWFKGLRISVNKNGHSIIALFIELLSIMTSSTITSLTFFILSKAITIKFQTLCFFTITAFLSLVWMVL